MQAVFFFCVDPAKDPVAPPVLAAARRVLGLAEGDLSVDGMPVLEARDADGNRLVFVRTEGVLSHHFARYAPVLRACFRGFDFAAHVNWHGGANAPDAMLSVHSLGDVAAGVFCRAEPVIARRVLMAIEEERRARGLDAFSTLTEATHWSGTPNGQPVELLAELAIPMVDVEIGSSPASFSHPIAAEVIARGIARALLPRPEDGRVRSLLCAGGVFLEPAFRAAALHEDAEHPLALAHALPKQWLISGGYGGEGGAAKLAACAASVAGGVHAIAYHEDLKAPLREQLAQLARRLGVPLLRRQLLREPRALPLW